MKRYLSCLLMLSLLVNHPAKAQQKTLNGVYAGLEVSLAVVMGGAMNRTDHTYLFRPDGTFNDQLGKPDWKTHVAGRYEVNGAEVTVHWNNAKNSKSTYKIAKGGDYLNAGSYNLLRMSGDNAIPPGFYKFSKMTSMGGMNTAMTYVAAASDNGLFFDGKGHFSNNRESATVVSGNNIGGGTHKESSGGGTYTLKDGLLTLNFADGRNEVHSFFARPDDKPIMAVVDGNIYFMDDDKDKPSKTKTAANNSSKSSGSNTVSAASSGRGTINADTGTGTTVDAADGKAILFKANSVHGGTSLDNIKTVHASAMVQGLQADSYIDAANNRMRLEIRQGGKLIGVEQLEDESGWRWQNGQVSALPANRIAEMSTTFFSGLLGLRKSVIDRFQVQKTQQVKTARTVICQLDGSEYIFMVNDQGQLLGAGDKSPGNAVSTSVFSDVRNTAGILIPFHEQITTGMQKLAVQYTSFEINPQFGGNTWSKPAGN